MTSSPALSTPALKSLLLYRLQKVVCATKKDKLCIAWHIVYRMLMKEQVWSWLYTGYYPVGIQEFYTCFLNC